MAACGHCYYQAGMGQTSVRCGRPEPGATLRLRPASSAPRQAHGAGRLAERADPLPVAPTACGPPGTAVRSRQLSLAVQTRRPRSSLITMS